MWAPPSGAPGAAPPVTANTEAEAETEVRLIVGPHAGHDSVRLRRHLQDQRQQVHWAVNSIFREHFTDDEPDEALVSPIPSEGRGGGAPSSSGDAPATVPGGSSPCLFDLHDSLTLHIASFLGATDLCNLGITCRSGRALASDDSLWRSLHLTYFGACVSAPPAGGSTTWRASYQDWRYLERTKTCVGCFAPASVVPLVFGFPSAALMRAAESGRMRFGWDYKTRRDASWACLSCRVPFKAYPWGAGAIAASVARAAAERRERLEREHLAPARVALHVRSSDESAAPRVVAEISCGVTSAELFD